MTTKLDRCIVSLVQGKTQDKQTPCVQVIDVRPSKQGDKKLIVTISDGINSCAGIVIKPSQKIDKFCIIKIHEHLRHTKDVVLIVKYTVEESLDSAIGNPKPYNSLAASSSAPSSPPKSSSSSSKSSVSEQKKSAGTKAADTFYDDGGMSSALEEGDKMSDQQVRPIANLNPYENQWVIKARVTQKSDMKHWDKGTSKGCLFSIELLDENGGQIRATFFNDVAKKYFDALHERAVYFFSGGKIKNANKKFTTIQHNYEITFDRDTIIQQARDSVIPDDNFNFTKFCDITNVDENSILDVVGIVKDIGEAKEFTTKNNRKTKRCNIKLMDNSSMDSSTAFVVELTVWGDLCDNLPFSANDVVIFKNVRKSNYNGVSLNTVNNTRIITDSSAPEYQALATWYSENRDSTEVAVSLTQRQTSANSTKTFKRKNVIQDIKSINVEDVTDPVFMTIRAYVSFVKPDQIWYDACPDENCGRKVTKQDDEYYCKHCDKNTSNCIRKYLPQFTVTDWTGKQWLSTFNDCGKVLFDGVSADDLSEQAVANPQNMQYALAKAAFSRFVFSVRITAERNEKTHDMKLKYNASRMYDIDYARESKSILGLIRDYGF